MDGQKNPLCVCGLSETSPSYNFVQRVSQHDSKSQVVLWHSHSPRHRHSHMIDSIHIIHHARCAL